MLPFPAQAPTPDTHVRVLATTLLAGPDPEFLDALGEWARIHLDGCTVGAINEARILVHELLTNAYRHAEPPYLVRLSAGTEGDFVRVEVTDATAATTTWQLGKGLLVVRGLCPRSGIHQHRAGKTVWADLRLLVGPKPSTTAAPERRAASGQT